MKVVVTASLCLLICGCDAYRTRPESDFGTFASTALIEIEGCNCYVNARGLVYVVSTSIDPRAREALASMRKVVSPSQVPEFSKIPNSNFVEITKFQIIGDAGLAEGKIDPYESGRLNCGEAFSIPFKNVNGAWHALVETWTTC
jgi:hypothetical protein